MGKKKKSKNMGDEIISHDMDLEYAEELLIHDEFIPEYFSWMTIEETKIKADELASIGDEKDKRD